MNDTEKEIWAFLDKHLQSIFTGDLETYKKTTSEDLSLYEWFVTPHRQDGLDFHLFMLEHNWAGAGSDYRYDLLERRLQLFNDMAIVSYTFLLTIARNGVLEHSSHNESRVLVKVNDSWKVIHVHKSPAWKSPKTYGEIE